MRLLAISLCLSLLGTCHLAHSQQSSSTQASLSPDFRLELEQQIQSALTHFHTPGMSLAIVHKGQTVYMQGHGIANINKHSPVSPDTYFRLASTSKAFTAAALAILVDEGKLSWEDKVIEHLPNFQLHDPWVTREFTITDLLTHRSGLSSGAGDMMIWPEPSGFTRQEVIHNLRFLSPQTSFRSSYAYSNLMYIVAGELVAKLSDMPFERFVNTRIFAPLEMSCFAGKVPNSKLKRSAMGYSYDEQEGSLPVTRNAITAKGLMSAAAGGMVCNASGMSKWLQALLQPDLLPFSSDSLEKMWSPYTILGVSDTDEEWDGTLFKSYGMGWRLANMDNKKVISHTGTLSGYQAYVALVPELELGVVILNNGSNYGARGAVMRSILSHYLPAAPAPKAENWVDTYIAYQAERKALYLAGDNEPPLGSGEVSINALDVSGEYLDKWYGGFSIYQQGEQLRFVSTKMPNLAGYLEPFQDQSYLAQWDDPDAEASLLVNFQLSPAHEVVGFRFHPYKKALQAQHDRSDMYFEKQESAAQ